MSEFSIFGNFSEEDSAGLFGSEHILYIIFTFVFVGFLLFLSRRVTARGFRKIHTMLTISLTLFEIVKIALNIMANSPIDDWIPFYFCGLFNFALWFLFSNREWLKKVGYSYITMGGILAGVFFTFYPSTSLARYPALHPASLHAAVFHGAMIYFGLLILMRGFYLPKGEDLKYYFSFISIASLISLFINHYFGANCMFLRDPFGLPHLSTLAEHFPVLYIIIVWLAQAFILFKISISIYNLIGKAKTNAFSNCKKHL